MSQRGGRSQPIPGTRRRKAFAFSPLIIQQMGRAGAQLSWLGEASSDFHRQVDGDDRAIDAEYDKSCR
jgi:hypothetical protein